MSKRIIFLSHLRIIAQRAVDGLALKERAVYIDDGTFGRGGHSRLIYLVYHKIRLIAIDEI